MAKAFNSILFFAFIFCSLKLSAADAAAATAPKENLNSKKEAPAVAAAILWLEQVDKKEYRASWETASSLFKSKVSAREWEKSLGAVRLPFGALISRKLVAKVFTKVLPGAPEGEYVVIQYESQFKNRKTVTETITPMLDDSTWRVSGYFAK